MAQAGDEHTQQHNAGKGHHIAQEVDLEHLVAARAFKEDLRAGHNDDAHARHKAAAALAQRLGIHGGDERHQRLAHVHGVGAFAIQAHARDGGKLQAGHRHLKARAVHGGALAKARQRQRHQQAGHHAIQRIQEGNLLDLGGQQGSQGQADGHAHDGEPAVIDAEDKAKAVIQQQHDTAQAIYQAAKDHRKRDGQHGEEQRRVNVIMRALGAVDGHQHADEHAQRQKQRIGRYIAAKQGKQRGLGQLLKFKHGKFLPFVGQISRGSLFAVNGYKVEDIAQIAHLGVGQAVDLFVVEHHGGGAAAVDVIGQLDFVAIQLALHLRRHSSNSFRVMPLLFSSSTLSQLTIR